MTDGATPQANTRMRVYWNEQAGPIWAEQHELLDAQLEPVSEAVLRRADLRAGERVLDIGCGCGATTLGAADRVGPEGRVLGVDLSGPMLERARARAEAVGLGTRIETLQADAQVYSFTPGAWDVALSRFGVMFFDDPEAAFGNIGRALRPGGRLVFACWQERARNPWIDAAARGALRHLEAPPPPEPGAPGPFSLADAIHTRSLLERAGFGEVGVDAFEEPIRMADLETASQLWVKVGPVAGMVLEQRPGPALLEKVREAVREELAQFDTREGLVAPAAAWLVSARREG